MKSSSLLKPCEQDENVEKGIGRCICHLFSGLLNEDKSFGGFNENYIGFDRLIDAVNKTGPKVAETFAAKVTEAVQVFVAERARLDARAKLSQARDSGR